MVSDSDVSERVGYLQFTIALIFFFSTVFYAYVYMTCIIARERTTAKDTFLDMIFGRKFYAVSDLFFEFLET